MAYIDPHEYKFFKYVRDKYLRLHIIFRLYLQIWRRFSIRAYLESHDSISMISAEDLVARRKQRSRYRTFLCDWYTIRKCWNHDKCPHIHYITGKPISCLITQSWSRLYHILVLFICKNPDRLVNPWSALICRSFWLAITYYTYRESCRNLCMDFLDSWACILTLIIKASWLLI